MLNVLMAFRLDTGRLDAPKRTPQGFLKAPAHLTRAGVLTYLNEDGSERREWRPAAEVFKADSLATLVSAPVTDLHPPEKVTAENRQKYDRGNVGDNIVRDGGRVAATIYVKDGRLISAIERGDMREVSCGYECELDGKPGVVPAGEPDAGQKYDAIQKNISYNHAAIVPHGRAGSEIRLHLDAAGDVVVPRFDSTSNNEDTMKVEIIDGIEYQVGTDAHGAACKRRDEATKAAKAEHDRLQAKADAADVELKKLRDENAALKDPVRLDAAIASRFHLVDKARTVLGQEWKADGKTDAQIKSEVVLKHDPSVKLDGKSSDYVEARFDAAIAQIEREANGGVQAAIAAIGSERADAAPSVDKSRDSMIERNRNAWKTPANGAAGK